MPDSFVSANQDRLLRELTEFLSIPSVSTLPDHAGECRRAAGWVGNQLRHLGCPVVELIEGDGHPVVWAEGPHVEGAPTLLIYGHYDVQPVDPLSEWHSPPFEPTVRDGKIFARGAVDDKGQVFCLLKAVEATRGPDGRPPVNLRFLIEGEEESGGRTIDALLEREPERAKADAILVSDMAFYDRGWPAVYTALRGLCYAEIHLRTAERDLHSGSYGGVAPNAVEALARLLTDLKARSGRIRIPKLYKAVKKPSKAELKAWKALPFDLDRYLRDEVTATGLAGLEEHSVFERTWALPTFEIHGIGGGFTAPGAKTVIPASAYAKVSMRLVPGLTFAKTAKWLTRAAKKRAPSYAEVEVKILHGADPVQVDVNHPSFAALDDAFEEVVGRRTVPIRSGGSIPVVQALAASGAPVLLTGIGLPDDGLHSPNEKLDLDQLWAGIEVYGRFFRKLAGARSEAA
ncbi:MAG: dipeptidase [Gemmatimonadales bacterium]